MTLPLEVICTLAVPENIASHRFVREASKIVDLLAGRDERVIGTRNAKRCEIYGWSPNIPPHADSTGFMYAMPLLMEESVVYLNDGEFEHAIEIAPGSVFRMDDRMRHWTHDAGNVVALFLGSFGEPCDASAMLEFGRATRALAAGEYYGAPRVSQGFHVLLDDECYVHNIATNDVETMLIEDARRDDALIIQCAKCDAPATRIDQHFPHMQGMNRCHEHLGGF